MNHSLREYSVLLTMESGRQVSTRVFAVGRVLARLEDLMSICTFKSYRRWLAEVGLTPGEMIPTLIHCGVLAGSK